MELKMRPRQHESSGAGSRVPGKKRARRLARQDAWEWVIAAVGVLVTVAAIGLMVRDGLSHGEGSLPDVVVRADSIVQVKAGYLLVFSALNEGDATAAEVSVKGTLLTDRGVVEERSMTLDFVPANSRRGGGLIFENDPRAFRVTLRAEGYQKP